LKTKWTSGNGEQETITVRESGESDEDFRARHVAEYMVDMLGETPQP
jgi:hypothetical protein